MSSRSLSRELGFFRSLVRFAKRPGITWWGELTAGVLVGGLVILLCPYMTYLESDMRQVLLAGIGVCAAFASLEVASFAVVTASSSEAGFLIWVSKKLPLSDLVMQFRLSLFTWLVLLLVSGVLLLPTYVLKVWGTALCIATSVLAGLYAVAIVLTFNAFETIVYWFLYKAGYHIRLERTRSGQLRETSGEPGDNKTETWSPID